MIEEDYVTFEQAKLLKEKGFPQEYNEYHGLVYNEEDYENEYEVQRMVLETETIKAGTLSHYPVGVPEPKCYCPTLSLVQKWFRKEKGIHIAPECDVEVDSYGNTKGSCYDLKMIVFDLKNEESNTIYLNKTYKTYEEALSDGIDKALKLI